MHEWVAFYLLLGWHIVYVLIHNRRTDKLLNRIMARDYREFEYFDKKYKDDLKEVQELRDEAREDRTQEVEITDRPENSEEVEKALDSFEEDWEASEVDHTKITEILK